MRASMPAAARKLLGKCACSLAASLLLDCPFASMHTTNLNTQAARAQGDALQITLLAVNNPVEIKEEIIGVEYLTVVGECRVQLECVPESATVVALKHQPRACARFGVGNPAGLLVPPRACPAPKQISTPIFAMALPSLLPPK
jgi:hypothetical protein